MNDAPIHVVGGGLAGLVAAITAAEGGAPVVLHEAASQLGGRARSGDGPYGVNLGPHVIYRGGALLRFLHDRGLTRELRLHLPRPTGVRVVDDRGVHGPWVVLRSWLAMNLRRSAPVDESFDAWARSAFGARIAAQLCHLSGLYTFHHDPGSLSASFVWERCRRTMRRPDTVRYVGGGWQSVVDALERTARERGVQIELGAPIDALPDAPVVVAVAPTAAAMLVDGPVAWPTARTALLDVALEHAPSTPAIVFDAAPDINGCCMAERFTAIDPTLAPRGVDLVQAQLGIADDVTVDAAVARMERTLDVFGDWRPREVWRRETVVHGASGAVDPPGSTWRDRPAIDRGDGRFLAGDTVAAPGILSEVSVNSGVRAAQLAVAERRRRQWAPGWASVELTPSMRAAVLVAAIDGASSSTHEVAKPLDEAWTAEPAAEVEPHRTHRRGLLGTRITAAEATERGTSVTTVTVPRR